jgi:serine/threonine protein phosphatase 1
LIIVGDVHGCYKTLLALIAKFPAGEQLCFVGDLIDRGPVSCRVVDLVLEQGWLCVMGNHERMALDSGTGRSKFQLWMMNGGQETKISYENASSYQAAPQKWLDHLRWMASLPRFIEFKDIRRDDRRHLLVSHAGFHQFSDGTLETALKEQVANDDVLWGREPIHDYSEVFQVLGHTPEPDGPRIERHFANIDTGAVFKWEPYGVLSALRFPETEIFTQPNIE